MKIVAISPNTQHLQALQAQCSALSHRIVTVEGGKSLMVSVADRETPDLMVVEGMCRDVSELAMAEEVTRRHPDLALVLLCATSSPEFLMQAMRSGVREVLPSPAEASQLADLIQRVDSRRKGAAPAREGKLIAFLPCKGGSGATFLATNFAWQLSQSASVLLVDLNLQFGEVLETLHDSRAKASIADLCQSIDRLDGSLLAASAVAITPNLSILAAPEDPGLAAGIKPAQVTALLQVATAHYDFVVADLPRSLDPLTLAALDQAWRIYPVLQPQLPALGQAARMASSLHALGYPAEKVRFILNRASRGGTLGLSEVREALGASALHVVPNDYRAVSGAIDQGLPLARTDRDNPVVKALAEMAGTLAPPQPASPSLIDRLLRRA